MKGIRLITLQLLTTSHSQRVSEKKSVGTNRYEWSNSLNIHI